jgi:XTP/dITP diphosphohydrolase
VVVYVATKNQGKLRELRALCAPHGWELRSYEGYADVAEGETSYEENAALKAAALTAQLRAAGIEANVLGDDSGLEVAALGGRPGVLSARYGGADATWEQRRTALLQELAASGSPDRRARFVCALHLIAARGAASLARGECDGEIAPRERGQAGFSYDPIFWYPPLGRTFAELSEEEKNSVSHRGLAVEALARLVSAGAETL